MINQICACVGPAFNEPLCSCKMASPGIERSDEYNEYMLPENVERRSEETHKVLSAIFGVK